MFPPVQSPPVSIPSDFSEMDSSCSRSRSSSASEGRGEERGDHTPSPPPPPPPSSSGFLESVAEGVHRLEDHTSSLPPPPSVGGDAPPTLKFWYIDHDGKSVLEKDCAAVTFNGKGLSNL